MVKAGRGSDQAMVRLPEGMRDRLKAAAEENGRSMNAEIVARLEESFDPEVQRLLHDRGYILGALESLLDAKLETLKGVLLSAQGPKK